MYYTTSLTRTAPFCTCNSRLVSQGSTQQEGIDYNDTLSPTAKLTTVRVIAAIAVRNEWELEQMDVDAAYLNASLKEDILYICASPEALKHLARRTR